MMPWRDRFIAEFARVTGETAEIHGPLQERYFRVFFSRCPGPCWKRRQIERVTAWLGHQESKATRLTIRKTE
jgi:hypothetical protein